MGYLHRVYGKGSYMGCKAWARGGWESISQAGATGPYLGGGGAAAALGHKVRYKGCAPPRWGPGVLLGRVRFSTRPHGWRRGKPAESRRWAASRPICCNKDDFVSRRSSWGISVGSTAKVHIWGIGLGPGAGGNQFPKQGPPGPAWRGGAVAAIGHRVCHKAVHLHTGGHRKSSSKAA